MRRRCPSPETMTWSKHSRRIDPISRSAKPFCQGEPGAIGLSRMPMARNRRVTAAVGPIPITDQVTRGFSPRECLCDLACNPFRGRMWCDIDPDKFSALQSNDDKDNGFRLTWPHLGRETGVPVARPCRDAQRQRPRLSDSAKTIEEVMKVELPGESKAFGDIIAGEC